jgi:hypothetical protein
MQSHDIYGPEQSNTPNIPKTAPHTVHLEYIPNRSIQQASATILEERKAFHAFGEPVYVYQS